ncbi:MAG: phage terminase small subunit P27 family [Planctomycetes bacterium]|nr:phage terminase small subunit P27 family [Planctomycetota bacterium]
MGGRGPSRTPKDILKLRGSWRADVRGEEPKAEPATAKSFRCPRWLTPEGKRVFKIVIKQLGVMGILTFADELLVGRYCDVYARWRRSRDYVTENGEGYPVLRDGKVVSIHKYPQTVVASQLLSELTKMEDRMGLSPGARANLAIDTKGLTNEPASKARFFKSLPAG